LEVAQAFGLSRSGVQSHKNKLARTVEEFMGQELLIQLQRPPQWRINLKVVRNGSPAGTSIR
jgi:hypothetical protein